MADKKSKKLKTYCFTHTFTHCHEIEAHSEQEAWDKYNDLITNHADEYQELKDDADENIECEEWE